MPNAPRTPVITTRMCVGCRQTLATTELVRFTLDERGELRVDYRGAAPGRGAWMCPSPRCLQQALKRNAFFRSFRRRVSYDTASLPGEVGQGLTNRVEAALRSARRAGLVTLWAESEPHVELETFDDGSQQQISTTRSSQLSSELSVSWGDPPKTWVIGNSVWFERVARAIDQSRTWESQIDSLPEPAMGRRPRIKGS